MKFNSKIAPAGYLSALYEHRSKRTRVAIYSAVLLFLSFALFITTTSYGQALTSFDESEESYQSEEGEYAEYDSILEDGCNVLGLSLYGEITTYYGSYGDYTSANSVRMALEEYAQHENIRAIVVDVDSAGGSPVGGDEIMHLLEELPVPVVAQIRELGASAAYAAILSADRIFAHEYGSIGSIGIIYPHYDYTRKNKKEGIEYQPIMSATGKDMGSTDRPMTDSERERIQDEIDYTFDQFVENVAMYRGLSKDKVLSIADGTTYIAPTALQLGLIDEVGGMREVKNYLRELIGDEPVICWAEEMGYGY